jgi:NAD(P)-dependent dehydrogenase (short-subunit alcohol dehydrogenase family)
MRGLENKVMVVCAGGTGAGHGMGASIGGATARRLAAEGAKVVVADIDQAAAERTVEAIVAQGGTAIAQAWDASDEAHTKALMDRAVAELGGIDGVHFNAMDMSAPVMEADGASDLLDLPIEVWQRSLDVGLTGFLLAARHSIPLMVERGGGSIVCTASLAAYLGEPVRVAYATTKAGMGAVVRHIASRFGKQGIRANSIAPGLVASDALLELFGEEGQRRALKETRSTRLGRPDDIAALVTFLLSDDAAWINGQAVRIDGGTTLAV